MKLSNGVCSFVLAGFLFTGSSIVLAHNDGDMWYPTECCHGQDCAPVLEAKPLPEGAWLVRSVHGSVLIPADFKRRDSQDGRMHVCMRPNYEKPGENYPICFFMPPAT